MEIPLVSLSSVGSDELKFEINSRSGLLSFEGNSSTGMDFEVPVDVDRDNVYLVTIGISDGIEMVDQNLTVTVTDKNEQPENLHSLPSLSVMENQPAGSFVGEFNASDQDANTILSYELASGAGGYWKRSFFDGRKWFAPDGGSFELRIEFKSFPSGCGSRTNTMPRTRLHS